MSDVVHGACLCGKVQWELSNAKLMVGCHCTRCQRWTGSSHTMTVISEPSDLEFTKGRELVKKFHEEGFADRYFCTNCGSGIYVDGGKKVYVGAGGTKNLDAKITSHIQVAHKAPWDEIAGSAPQFPEWPAH